ncbi:hypothetical protein CY34DRAFT_12162 [Suillus luteus UH-Slu-Lm8-n1]|uniref:Uncharacterized protein n=1 Tax=Suillus luteus UH-Slu-Lm8-n1 TaxID=930992 RepID=A0A0C9ZYK4_9AGAM|nr:hypothetical protein CY34DRAFT_12162 [Suillus luteus UH-Slu-Lm8-n1]
MLERVARSASIAEDVCSIQRVAGGSWEALEENPGGSRHRKLLPERENRGSAYDEEIEGGKKQPRDDSESEEESQPSSKRSKTVDVSKFPWSQKRNEALASLPEDIRQTYQQLENFSPDPKAVVTDILSTPGCPPFPPSEWLNLVKWKYVDLAKVLDSAHTTELDPKKTHIIDDEIELALRVSKSSGGIKTSSDHNIAFSMYIDAVSFVFPQ